MLHFRFSAHVQRAERSVKFPRPSVFPEIIYLINIPNIESHLSIGSQVLHQYYGSGVCYF